MDELLKLFLGEVPQTPKVGDKISDLAAMKLALAEAWKGIGRTSPNPMVGCVILSEDNAFLGKGYHTRYGEPHAEIEALRDVVKDNIPNLSGTSWNFNGYPIDKIEKARVFVTLEPCAHEGKTPSCAKTLAQLPIKEVIYGLQDPNPEVAGKGIRILKAKGIQCRSFKEVSPEKNLNREFEEVCEHFLMNMREKRVFVSLKVASSLDGIFALKSGESQWITNETSRLMGHLFRGSHDAILVGRGTVERDNPALNIRHPYFRGIQKKLVVVDTQGKLLKNPDLKIFKSHAPENLIWAVGEDYKGKPDVPVQLIRLPSDDRGLDLGELHRKIWETGIRSLYIEAGGKTLSAHLRAEKADRLILFQAPTLLGGLHGRSWTEGFGVEKLDHQIHLSQTRRVAIQDDLLVTGRLNYGV